jgi:hypothetical protein
MRISKSAIEVSKRGGHALFKIRPENSGIYS